MRLIVRGNKFDAYWGSIICPACIVCGFFALGFIYRRPAVSLPLGFKNMRAQDMPYL